MTRLSTSISLQSQYKIKLSNLSPKLAVSSNLSIPIPGQETKSFDENIVTIQTIDSSIIMLPTKTRPKKIKFLGSDGKHYQFLCKGQEDLRVDEQISHLFTICNHLFDSLKSNQRDPSMPYSLRSYNVTPLGPRSGLIQWVENAVSIYTTYRSWRSSKVCLTFMLYCKDYSYLLVESIPNKASSIGGKKPKLGRSFIVQKS